MGDCLVCWFSWCGWLVGNLVQLVGWVGGCLVSLVSSAV